MKPALTLLTLALFAVLLLPGFTGPDHKDVAPPAGGSKVKYSKKVDAIIQAKCFGCHNPEARFDKPKMALNWVALPDMSASEQGDKLKEIVEVLEKGSMPPAKFLEGNPDKKMTPEETATLKKWAEKTAKKVAK